jgi:hypothetical protein
MTKQSNKVTKETEETNVTEDVIPVEVNEELENTVKEETESIEEESVKDNNLEESLEKSDVDTEIEVNDSEVDEIQEEVKEEVVKVVEPKGVDFSGILITKGEGYSIYSMK